MLKPSPLRDFGYYKKSIYREMPAAAPRYQIANIRALRLWYSFNPYFYGGKRV